MRLHFAEASINLGLVHERLGQTAQAEKATAALRV
jgi:hypothetical protein